MDSNIGFLTFDDIHESLENGELYVSVEFYVDGFLRCILISLADNDYQIWAKDIPAFGMEAYDEWVTGGQFDINLFRQEGESHTINFYGLKQVYDDGDTYLGIDTDQCIALSEWDDEFDVIVRGITRHEGIIRGEFKQS